MADIDNIKKLSVYKILDDSSKIITQYPKSVSLFTLGHFVFLCIFEAINRWESPFFIIWAAAYYMYGVYFYRFYFNRAPYFTLKTTIKSLLPSTKILFITVVLLSLILVLPYIPLFLFNDTILLEKYADFLDIGMQKSRLIDFASNIIFIIIYPLIFFRPFMAWIASLVGRRGSIRVAYGKTRGNYWRFMALGVLMNLPVIVYNQIEFFIDINNYLTWLVTAPLVTYCSIIFAKCYEFFYLDNGDDD